MRRRDLLAGLGAAAAALALPAAQGLARGRPAAPAARADWTRTVAPTAEGGFRMGNPAAPVKLVEYGSITCHHCADFSAQGGAALRDRYIRPGRLSWEFRPYLLFPTDPGLFILLTCLGPRGFFPVSDQLYAGQRDWLGRIQALPAGELQRLGALPPVQRSAAFVRAAGLDRVFRQRGMTAARIDACLNDRAGLNRLGEITRAANALGIFSTPTFLINGRSVGTQDWARLEPMLGGL